MFQPRFASLLTLCFGVGATVALLAGVVPSGAQPPWSWGFLQGAVLGLAALWILVQILYPGPEVCSLTDRTARRFVVSALLLLAWMGLSYLFDVMGWDGRGIEALARTPTAFAVFLAASFLLGMSLGVRYRLVVLMGALTVLGVGVGVFGLLRLYTSNWPSLWGFGTTGRLQSFYTNPNRVAVLLAICWSCGAGWTGYWWCKATRRREEIGATWARGLAAVVAACTLLGATAMVLTLSRMTLFSSLLAVLLVAAFSAYAIRHPHATHGAAFRAQPRMRGLLLSAGLLLLVVLLLLGLSLTVGGHHLANRMEDTPLDTTGRLEFMETGVKIWGARPLVGTGLGTLESLFSEVCLPSQQDMRVVEVHNDWLQLGIELGALGLLLAAALAVSFALLWWRSMRRAHRLRTRMLLAGGAVAVLVPLFCSLADFPLRQPATAGLLFLLAGALMQTGLEERTQESGTAERMTKGRRWFCCAVGAVLLVAFTLTACFCLQRGQAVAATPWLGQVYPRVPVAEDAAAYAAGCRMDPDNPDLWHLFACAQSERTLQTKEAARRDEERQRFLVATDQLIRLNLRDYRPHYLRANLAYREGLWDEALVEVHLALRRAHFSFLYALERDVLLAAMQSVPCEDPRREGLLANALACLRRGVEEHRWSERGAVEALLRHGALAGEAVQFWPPDDDAKRITRARFYVRFDLNERARAELNEVREEEHNDPWFLALRCYLDLTGEQEERGLEAFSILIRQLGSQPDPAVLAWMQAHLPNLSGQRLLVLVRNEVSGIGNYPGLCRSLLPKLSAVSLSDADRLWGKVVHASATAEHLRQWAELAARMGDRPAARIRSRDAWERSSRSDEWNRWYAEFRRKWKLTD